MEEINSDFKGIELAVIYPQSHDAAFLKKIKQNFVSSPSLHFISWFDKSKQTSARHTTLTDTPRHLTTAK
jgi:hypothetical protein